MTFDKAIREGDYRTRNQLALDKGGVFAAQRAELKELTTLIAQQKTLIAEVTPVVEDLTTEMVRHGQTAAEVEKVTKAAEEQRKALEKAAVEARKYREHIDDAVLAIETLAARVVNGPLKAAGKQLDEAFGAQMRANLEQTVDPLERIDALLRNVDQMALEGASARDRLTILNGLEAELRTSLAITTDAEKRKEIEERLRKVLAEQQQIRNGIKVTASATTDGLAAAADEALKLVTALSLGNSEIGRMVAGAAELLKAVQQIRTAAPSVFDEEGNFLSGGLGLGGALATSGMIIGGGAAIASGLNALLTEDPAERRARDENTKAIRELTAKVGLLGAVALSGDEGVRARGLAQQIRLVSGGGALAPGSATFKAMLGADNVGFLEDVARELGITLDGSVDSFRRLADAIDNSVTKLGEFADDFASLSAQMEAERAIFGDQGPLANLTRLAGVAGGKSSGIAGIFGGGVDASTAEGQAEIRKRVEALFRTMQAGDGKLTAEQLGGLSGDEFLGVLKQIIEYLNALGNSVAEKFRQTLADVDTEAEILDLGDDERLKRRADAYAALGGAVGDLFAGLDVAKPEDMAALDERIRALFAQLKTSPESVDLAGLSIEELIRILLELDGAADQVAAGVQSAADAFAEAAGRLDVEADILRLDPTQRAAGIAGAAGASFAPIAAALAGLDLSTADGRQRAEEALQALYTANKGDGALVDAIRTVLQAIRAVPGAAGAATGVSGAAGGRVGAGERAAVASGARNLTEVTGNRMADYLATIALHTRATAAALEQLLTRGMGALVTPPALPAGAGAALAAGGVVMQVRVTLGPIQVLLGGGATGLGLDAAQRYGAEFGLGAVRTINEQLGSALQSTRLLRGDTSRPGL